MQRIDKAHFSTNDYKFQGGNPTTGLPATQLTPDWCNAVQEELAHVVEGANITLSANDNSQVLAALRVICGRTVGSQSNEEPSMYGSGQSAYFKLSTQAIPVPAYKSLDITVCCRVGSDASSNLPNVEFWLSETGSETYRIVSTEVNAVIESENPVDTSSPITVRLVLPAVTNKSRQINLCGMVAGNEINFACARIAYSVSY